MNFRGEPGMGRRLRASDDFATIEALFASTLALLDKRECWLAACHLEAARHAFIAEAGQRGLTSPTAIAEPRAKTGAIRPT